MSEHEDCRTYMDHTRLQHRRMNQIVERLRPLIHGAAGCDTAFVDAKQLIGDLADQFGRHVAEEAGGGCVEEAVCRCPRLSPQACELNAQYVQIQATIARIAARFAGCDRLGNSCRLVEQELEQLGRELCRLESDERYILREAFGTDESFSSIRTESANP
jgi:hypothetical protein